MDDRNDILGALGVDIRRMLTIGPNGISLETEQDANSLLRILDAHPRLPEVLAARSNPEAEAIKQMMLDHINRATAEQQARQDATAEKAGQASSLPRNPLRMSQALEQYKVACVNDKLAEKTIFERQRLLKGLATHVAAGMPDADGDPFLHQIGMHHVSNFLDKVSRKASKDGALTTEPAASRTIIKKVSTLRTFFEWAREDREATLADLGPGLDRREKALRMVAPKEDEHYEPFDVEQLLTIFEPSKYLAFNNQADYFWAPLLGLHLGTRLKELITLKLADIERHEPTGIWFMDVKPENANNPHSIRRLPIATRLVELGFIDYVERIRRLEATMLFPHRDLTSTTGRRDPSKNCSRRFGEYLDTLAIVAPSLVFHSFRHTVVTALQDAGTPLKDSMEITGHQAQDYAVRTGKISAEQAQSVHVLTYTHADKPVVNREHPLARLHQHLDNAIQVPLDYARLRKAAIIVTEHVVKTMDGFKSGWSPLQQDHTDAQIARLNVGGQ